MGVQTTPMDRDLDRGIPGRFASPLKATFVGFLALPLLAGLCALVGWTTPIVLRITRFGVLAGLAITAGAPPGTWVPGSRKRTAADAGVVPVLSIGLQLLKPVAAGGKAWASRQDSASMSTRWQCW